MYNRDMFMKHRFCTDWDYSLMYDADNKEYVIVEMYFNNDGDPVSWCVAEIANSELKEMDKILKRLVLQLDGGLYFISKGHKITKHKGRAM